MNAIKMADSTPELVLTSKIRKVLEDFCDLDLDTNDENIKLQERCKFVVELPDNKVISVKLIRDVYRNFRNNGKQIYIHELVEGADLVAKPVTLPPRDPELEARVQRLRVEEENREYRRMTQNVDPNQGNQTFSFQSEVKSMNRQLTAVLNFLITVAAGFAFGYKAVEYSYGKLFPIQMMAGLTVGTVIFFVDLYFMVRYTPM